VCVLVQAHAATLALIVRLAAGTAHPPRPGDAPDRPDGHEVLVDLATAPFGAGRHACPGRHWRCTWLTYGTSERICPRLTASGDRGFTIDEAEIISCGQCPECTAAAAG
jgi:hypothetical protein